MTSVPREIDPLFTYNAIKLSAREVASTFVAPDAYDVLIRHDNAILAGPRGSGKTTLLKMLQSEALEAWDTPSADGVRDTVQACGVFVGVDRMWSEQIRVAPPGMAHVFGSAAYALRIGRSLANAMDHRTTPPTTGDRPHLRTQLDPSDIKNICHRFATLFKLPTWRPTFSGMAQVFGDRLTELGAFRNRIVNEEDLPDWMFLDPLQASSELATQFNACANEPDRKWAMLFDELELAPDTVVSDILGRLRGDEPRLVFKLSLSPILRTTDLLSGELGAVHGQDVEYIPLTSAIRGSDRFVRNILESQLSAVSPGLAPSVYRVFGESRFDNGESARETPSRTKSPYRAGSPFMKDLERLKDVDSTFEKYLDARGIDITEIPSLPDDERAATVRKIRNIVVVRSYYFGGGERRRSRKSRELYAGASSLIVLPDGNPRMATIMSRLLVDEYTKATTGRVTPARQAEVIDSVTARFHALLDAQVGVTVKDKPFTLINLLDAIGRALSRRLILDPFSADVPAGFYVDKDVRTEFMFLLTQAVNTGAIVHMPRTSSEPVVASSPKNRHYRLSYLLAPKYGLPMRVGKTVALSGLLRRQGLRGPRNNSPSQATLEGMEIL